MTTINHSERKHAILSASSAVRWLACPPSARLGVKVEDARPPSKFAEEGTFAHEISELYFAQMYEGMTKRTFNSRLKKMKTSEYYNDELQAYVMEYVDFVEERINSFKANDDNPLLYFEERLDFSHYVPEGFGTGDVMIYSNGALEIIDLKFGKGVEVSAERNPQLMLYGLGGLEALSFIEDVETVTMTIMQPRLNNISKMTLSAKELIAWGDEIKPIADLAFKGEGEFNPGEAQCRFCPIKATCIARSDKMKGLTSEMKTPYTMSIDEIADILYEVDEIARWAKDVKDYAQEQAIKGKSFEGWKLVEGRSIRKYTDEDAVINTLKENDYEDVYEPQKLLSISKLEKLIGKKKVNDILEHLIEKPQGKPTLVPESDKRQEWNSAESDFDEIK